eukprot:1179181-Alexandrium_andersonii.AAC.1
MSSEVEDILGERAHECVLPDAAAKAFETKAFQILASKTALGNVFHRQGQFDFHTTTKPHYLVHLGSVARYNIPRIAWNYAGEDFTQR